MPAADDLAQARSVPLKHERASVIVVVRDGHVLIKDCLAANGILPGNTEQAVIFSEYADSAEWIADRLKSEGFTARIYSGRQTHTERDEIRLEFMRGDFQIIVTTDAGNEGSTCRPRMCSSTTTFPGL